MVASMRFPLAAWLFAPAAALKNSVHAHSQTEDKGLKEGWDKALCEGCTPIQGFREIPTEPPAPVLTEHNFDCGCLNWKKVYLEKGATCGMGLELFSKKSVAHMPGREKAAEKMQGDYCDDVYKKLDTYACLTANMGESPDHWCYVSHKCAELNGGWRVPGINKTWKTSIKKCSAGQDEFLGNATPHNLASFAKQLDIEVGLLVKMAYPTVENGEWQNVSQFWSTENTVELDEKHMRQLEEVVSAGKPVVWGSKTGAPPFGVTMGMKAYEVGPNKFFHRGKTHWKCVHDCVTDQKL